MQIDDNGFSIFVSYEDETYKYYIQKSQNDNKEYIGNHDKKPIKLGSQTKMGKILKTQIQNNVLPNQYDDIELYYNQIMEKLQNEFDEYIQQKQEENKKQVQKDNKEYKIDGYALKDSIYWKIKYQNDDIVYEYKVLKAEIVNFHRISDYSYNTSNYFDFELKVPKPNNHNEGKRRKFYGTKDNIITQIMKNDLAWDEQKLKEFIYKFIFENSEKYTEKGVIGGYCSWNDIEKPPQEIDVSSLTDYFKNHLTDKHLEVVKALLLVPFHYILRHDEKYMARNVVKFVIICGVPSAFKNGIVNIVRNMFDFYRTIPIDEGGTPSSYASLRNAIDDNIGFLMCDESNGVFLDDNKKFKNSNIAPVENLLKGIFQTNMPNVSSQTTGQNLDQHYNATPIFIWNDDFKKTEALKDRCICIEFIEEFNRDFENLFDVNEEKKNLLIFGNVFAYCFQEHWNKLQKEGNWEELVNKILKYMQEEYNVDTEFLIEIKVEEKETNIDIEEMFFNRMHYKFRQIYNLEAYIEGTTINHSVFDKLDIDFLYLYNSKSVYFYKTKFINYIRDKVAQDGGLTEKHIEDTFDMELSNKGNRDCYRFDISDFMDKINKIDETFDEEEDDIVE